MSDADLIYNALLRTERRIETAYTAAHAKAHPSVTHLRGALIAVEILREEIGKGIAFVHLEPKP